MFFISNWPKMMATDTHRHTNLHLYMHAQGITDNAGMHLVSFGGPSSVPVQYGSLLLSGKSLRMSLIFIYREYMQLVPERRWGYYIHVLLARLGEYSCTIA